MTWSAPATASRLATSLKRMVSIMVPFEVGVVGALHGSLRAASDNCVDLSHSML